MLVEWLYPFAASLICLVGNIQLLNQQHAEQKKRVSIFPHHCQMAD